MLRSVFTDIYDRNTWSSAETRSGGGSEISRTKQIRENLLPILTRLQARTLLDAGCGDWNWMSTLEFPGTTVLACDIVHTMIADNWNRFGDRATFFVTDITQDPLPRVDVILCRTVLFHLSFEHIRQALQNFKRSGATYLLLTHHPHHLVNIDIQDGNWRRLNMCLEPFLLPEPIVMFEDGDGNDGYLGLWNLSLQEFQ